MTKKYQDMLNFWSDRVGRHGINAKSNTKDVWLREVEIAEVMKVLECYKPSRVLDFGCANGYTTQRLAKAYPDIVFVGVDINKDMIVAANRITLPSNLSFKCGDLLVDNIGCDFDLVIAIRVFQNIESIEKQIRVFNKIHDLLVVEGHLYFIESYADGYEQINQDRGTLGLPPLPIHSHLTLLTEKFDLSVEKILTLLEKGSPSSAYYLITRLIYSKLANMNNENINYDHPLHQIAALVPQIGEYGPEKSRLYIKKGNL